jgi:hypothetical protein
LNRFKDSSRAGLTRASIQESAFPKAMDGRVKPGNDEEKWCRARESS